MERRSVWGFWGGMLLIGLGVLFFLGEFIGGNVMSFLWPFFIIAVGVSFFVVMI